METLFGPHDQNIKYLESLLSVSVGGRGNELIIEGELVVSAETANREAPRHGWTPAEELQLYLIHGALHPRPNADLHLSTAARVRHSLLRLRDGGYGVPIGFFGHTHRAAIHELRGDAVLTHEGSVELRPGSHYLINPGSVGQPRDGDPRPSFALFDTRAAGVRLHRVAYDHAPCLARAAAAGLLRPPPPESPLERGRRRVARIFQRGLEVLERLERRGWP